MLTTSSFPTNSEFFDRLTRKCNCKISKHKAFNSISCVNLLSRQVFFEPLKKLVGSTEAPSLLLSSCSTQFQRSRLHQLGFSLGISQWIEDYKSRVLSRQQEDLGLKLGVDQNELQKRPIAVVRPVPFSNKQIEKSEVSSNQDQIQFSDLTRMLTAKLYLQHNKVTKQGQK